VKKILGFRLSAPEKPGYPDKCRIEDVENGMIIFDFHSFSTNPNPVRPSDGAPWKKAYGQLFPGELKFECVTTPKHGKCLSLNSGGDCKTTFPNLNPETKHPGSYTAQACLIHCGFRGKADPKGPWRGSAACQTFDPEVWPSFIANFELGERGIYILIDEQKA
jgi:hypothetical protein